MHNSSHQIGEDAPLIHLPSINSSMTHKQIVRELTYALISIERKTTCYRRCFTSWYNKFWTTLCNMVHHIMNHLWRQCNSNRNKKTKLNQHICRDTRVWSRDSAKPTSVGLSPDAKDFIIYQLGYKLVLYEKRLPFSPMSSSSNSLTVKHIMSSPHSLNSIWTPTNPTTSFNKR